MLNIRTYQLGYIQTNCYVISNQHKECLIIDPGGHAAEFIRELKKLQLKPLAILLTHAHFDHIGAVDQVRDAYSIPVYLHKAEEKWLKDPLKNGSGKYAEIPSISCKDADHLMEKEQEMNIGDFSFQLLVTPGHSPGSVTFYFKEEGFAIVGDTLFQNSIGRTDLPGGNQQQLMDSIHTKLLSMPEDTIIYPGHGTATTISEEMTHNPFLNGF